MVEVRFKTDAKISISDSAVEYARKVISGEIKKDQNDQEDVL